VCFGSTFFKKVVYMPIIGYIHVCQQGEWKRSFNMLINAIRLSQLYNNTQVIRIGVVNEVGHIINDDILQDSKYEVIYLGNSSQYERPTLLHMRAHAFTDPPNTFYYYLHTKGLRHFGKHTEANVISWINLMLHWNIGRWRYANEILNTFSTYGCEFLDNHYSGNFWWATANHIKQLPNKIESFYVAPELWLCIIKNKAFCAYKTCTGYGGLYGNVISPNTYRNLTNKQAYQTNFQPKKPSIIKMSMHGKKIIVNSNRTKPHKIKLLLKK
jgi:hypothetical protein